MSASAARSAVTISLFIEGTVIRGSWRRRVRRVVGQLQRLNHTLPPAALLDGSNARNGPKLLKIPEQTWELAIRRVTDELSNRDKVPNAPRIVERRIAVDGDAYLIFANQPSAQGEAVCVTTGAFDSGFTCDGNEGQLEGGQGLVSLFAEDEFCNCDSYGWKANVGGCDADVCAPEGLVSVYLR